MIDLEQFAKDNKLDVKELQTIEATLKRQYTISVIPESDREKYVEIGIKNYVDRFSSLGLDSFFAVILQMSQPKDGVAKQRAESVKQYTLNPMNAIMKGFCAEFKDGQKKGLLNGVLVTKPAAEIPKSAIYIPDTKTYIVPLDNRETFPGGKKNFSYGRAIPTQQFFTNIEGLCSKDGNTWFPFKMTFNCDEHLKVPMSKLIKFRAKTKQIEPNLVLAYNSKYTIFELVKDGDINQLNAEIMNFYDNIQLKDIENSFKSRKTNFDVISVVGTVISKWQKEPTDDKPYPWMTVRIRDQTSDMPLKLLAHPEMSAEFHEGDYVKVWGSLSEGNVWDPDLNQQTNEKEITMFCIGIFPFTFGIPESTPQEQNVDDGWES